MNSADREALSPTPDATVGPPDERDRELLDYLIERAWQELLLSPRRRPENENQNQTKNEERVA